MEPVNIGQQCGDDLVASADAQRSPGEKIVLNVGNDQRIVGLEGFHRSCALLTGKN